MVSIIATQSYAHVPKAPSHKAISNIANPSLNFTRYPPTKPGKYKKASKRRFKFTEVNKTCNFSWKIDGSLCCLCKNSDGDAQLEAEILEYMSKSDRPTMFPTKAELLRSGRWDLVEAIKKRGGWYCLGWDDEVEVDNGEAALECDVGELKRRVENSKEGAVLSEQSDDFLHEHGKDDGFACEVNGSDGNLDFAAWDRSLESHADEETGIEGILNRLEKQRNITFGINLEKVGDVRADLDKISSSKPRFDDKASLNSSNGKFEPENWRNWSNHRAGFQETQFEAAEIYFPRSQVEGHNRETDIDGLTVITDENIGSLDRWEDINNSQVRARLQHLELELNSVLISLKTKREESTLNEVITNSNELHNLSDACEFQENEIMNAHERLRSIRAKLAVIEGKMALAIIDAQKIAEAKQKRIDSAHKALQLLQTTCIVWPNTASEVLLAGSFDGWTTQRKMEKSKTGIFSVFLKLYPGKYEIKFIVDGIWRTDPLRPIVTNNGHENNLLIVT